MTLTPREYKVARPTPSALYATYNDMYAAPSHPTSRTLLGQGREDRWMLGVASVPNTDWLRDDPHQHDAASAAPSPHDRVGIDPWAAWSGVGARSLVPEPGLRQSRPPRASHPPREYDARANHYRPERCEDALPARPWVHIREHDPNWSREAVALVPHLQSGDQPSQPRAKEGSRLGLIRCVLWKHVVDWGPCDRCGRRARG